MFPSGDCGRCSIANFLLKRAAAAYKGRPSSTKSFNWIGLLLLCSFHVLPSIRASQKVLILFSSKSWVQLSHWIILEGWTETAPWRDFNKFQLLELVCKLGKWLEDLLFDIIPKHSQTLHILRVKEAESEKSSKSSSTTWNSRSSSSSSGWRVIRQRHNGKNGSGCSYNCVPFCTHLHFFTLPCTYTWTFALPCAYFALAFALRRTPSTDRDQSGQGHTLFSRWLEGGGSGGVRCTWV